MNRPDDAPVGMRAKRFGDRVLFLAQLYLAGLVLFGSVRYATSQRGLYGLLAIVGAGCAAALWLIKRRASAETRVGVALSIVSLGLAVYGAELVAGVMDPRLGMHLPPTGPGMDGRSMHEVVTERRAGGEDVLPLVVPSGFLNRGSRGGLGFLPLAGVSGALTYFCNETGTWLSHLADRHGFNNPPDAWSDPELVIVGDSFAHGMCVEDSESIAGLLRRSWPRTLNLAVAGNGPLLMLAALREFADGHEPDVVVWVHYGGNDLDNLFVEGHDSVLLRYLEPDFRQGLRTRQATVDSTLRSWVDEQYMNGPDPHRRFSLPSRAALLRTVRVSALRERLGLTQRPAYRLDLFARALEEADRTIQGWGGRALFVHLPSYGQLTGRGRARGDPAAVMGIARGLGWPVVNVREVFEADGSDPIRYFSGRPRDPGHYSPLGYRLVVEAIEESLNASAAPIRSEP